MQSLGFGIIGLGNIAPIHAAAIRATPDAKLVAVATRNPERGSTFAAEHGGTWYADYREMLKREDIHIVTICTPHDLHLPMTLDAAAAGKHVLCEKPMARNVAECDQMIAACERAGVTLGVVFQSRFEPLVRKLKTALDDGQIGKLLWASTSTIWYRTDEYYRSAAWRGTWEHEGGGVLINQASHALDLFLWLTGMPARVTARMRTLNHQIEVEDAVMAQLEYASGALGSVQATTIAFPGFSERMEFFGERGSVIYHKGEGRLEWHWREPREDRVDEAEAWSGATGPQTASAAPHAAQFQDFAAAIREHRAPLVDGREARRSIEVIEAIYRSARADQPVSLPLQ
ncbi:MAG: Gfo/Idh/MocA family oxidoreductase [Chloroflexi bacterium]|nr:Gfo/Idh/MocA family oxidoreductase [Chloroflexota bacterium]